MVIRLATTRPSLSPVRSFKICHATFLSHINYPISWYYGSSTWANKRPFFSSNFGSKWLHFSADNRSFLSSCRRSHRALKLWKGQSTESLISGEIAMLRTLVNPPFLRNRNIFFRQWITSTLRLENRIYSNLLQSSIFLLLFAKHTYYYTVHACRRAPPLS